MEFSNAEWRVMSEVWRRERVTVNDVHQALQGETGWAYSTVKTMLGRLAEKGALAVDKAAKQSVYTALISRESARTVATESLIERVFEGATGGLFQHLLGGRRLSKTDRAKIQALLDEEEQK